MGQNDPPWNFSVILFEEGATRNQIYDQYNTREETNK